ncbi:MAG TPA: hypothetical protein PLI09_01695 [Candidatus Hydrogenedentes bacterium]|nr:hypothetical protein [Candidatus Hydrogenedentota bacterium]
MKLGMLTAMFSAKPLKDVLELIRPLGLECVELSSGNYSSGPHSPVKEPIASKPKRDELKALLKGEGLTISALCGPGKRLNMDEPFAKKRPKDRGSCMTSATLSVIDKMSISHNEDILSQISDNVRKTYHHIGTDSGMENSQYTSASTLFRSCDPIQQAGRISKNIFLLAPSSVCRDVFPPHLLSPWIAVSLSIDRRVPLRSSDSKKSYSCIRSRQKVPVSSSYSSSICFLPPRGSGPLRATTQSPEDYPHITINKITIHMNGPSCKSHLTVGEHFLNPVDPQIPQKNNKIKNNSSRDLRSTLLKIWNVISKPLRFIIFWFFAAGGK